MIPPKHVDTLLSFIAYRRDAEQLAMLDNTGELRPEYAALSSAINTLKQDGKSDMQAKGLVCLVFDPPPKPEPTIDDLYRRIMK